MLSNCDIAVEVSRHNRVEERSKDNGPVAEGSRRGSKQVKGRKEKLYTCRDLQQPCILRMHRRGRETRADRHVSLSNRVRSAMHVTFDHPLAAVAGPRRP